MRRALAAAFLLLALTTPTTAHDDLNAAANAYRGSPLTTSALLEDVAHQRAVEVASVWAHVDLTGRLGCYAWGEIIAAHTTPQSAEGFIAQWDGSPPHKAILLGSWTWIGSGTYEANGRTYAVILFLNPCSIVDVIPDTAMEE